MAKWLRYEKALASKVYRDIAADASDRLHDSGHFAKEDVLESTGYQVISDDIRWDYIKRMIEEQYDVELVPLAFAYFKRHSKKEEMTVPARFIATGYGKRTVGFALVSEQNGHLVLSHLDRKRGKIAGAVKSANKSLSKAKQAIPSLEHNLDLPELADHHLTRRHPMPSTSDAKQIEDQRG